MKADLAMAIHFHQPVGNFDHVIEHACEKCYKPFLATLKKYPEVKMTLHFSGCLLEWAEEKRPEIIDMIREMAEEGQIEIMSGGFYEPVLSSIPEADRVPQINMLTEYVKDKLSFEAQGAWVAERVWEPDLPSVFHEAGIKYVVLDDTHLLYSGIPKEKTYGFYVTEDNAKSVAVFPSDKVLRYLIPFKMPEECIAYMQSVMETVNDPLFIYGDDGEKFGEWPGTYKWVFEEKWLEKFFDCLMENSQWLKTVKLSDSLKERAPEGRVYLPATSYEEMLEWALPAEAQEQLEDALKDLQDSGKEELFKPFIKGGFWRNFLSKYPESDYMNKRMVYVSGKIQELRSGKKKNSPFLKEAEKELFRSQCNCAYWHGVFGGLYLFHLRRAIYHHLIKSEVLIDKVRHGNKSFCEATVLDIDADGSDEVILENREVALFFDPAEGGTLKEIDIKNIAQNLINTLARRKEAYHRKILEKVNQETQEGPDDVKTIHDGVQSADIHLKDHLNYDKYERYSLIDHFLDKDVEITTFYRSAYDEKGDFIKGRYDCGINKTFKGIVLTMKRDGVASGNKVHVLKEITLPKKGSHIKMKYVITNKESDCIDLIFAPEFNITMPDADSSKYAIIFDEAGEPHNLNETVQRAAASEVKIVDSNKGLSFKMTLSQGADFWHFPVKTVSQSEKAYELNYQGSVILPRIDLMKLGGKEAREIDIDITLA